MSKKKKHQSDGPRPLISRRLRRRFIRLFLFATVASTAYAFYDPAIIPDEGIKGRVESLRSQALDLATQSQSKLPTSLPQEIASSNLLDKLPQGAILGEQQIDVDTIFSSLTSKLKQLPQDQVKQIKRDFCSDLIYEATTSAQR